jgi:predicted ATPase
MTDHEVAAILRELGRYIGILRQSAEATTRAEDRARYQSHLAAAAEMFESIYAKRSRQELDDLVKRERRSFGWDYLSDKPGAEAEAAFAAFDRALQDGTYAT